MRFIERLAVLLAACLLCGVLYISRHDVPPAAAEVAATPSTCSDQRQPTPAANAHVFLAARDAPAPVLSPAELLTLPRQIQEQLGGATKAWTGPAADYAAARPALAEHIVLTLPWQIQQQVRLVATAMVPCPSHPF